MQHRIPAADLGPHGDAMARAVTTCVHCGFCLAACPTYKVMGEEMDSPRGRIVLMKQALEGELTLNDTRPYIDRCLGCLACETACPSGVRYRELVVPFRARLEEQARPAHERMFRQLLLSVLESPVRFRAAHRAGRVARLVTPLLPARLRGMLHLLPARLPAADPLSASYPAIGQRRARVALLIGCVQRVLRPSVNRATVRVLTANGVEVVVPPDQGCCGALALHCGYERRGLALADHNTRLFPTDVDAIVTNAAGCGSAMKEHGYGAPVQDVAEFLDGLGLHRAPALPRPTTVAYHDACHLAHGQGIRSAPRRLLRQIANLTLVHLEDEELCCGSAGLYNLEHPDTAAELGRRKAAAISAAGPDMVATGNLGCLTQLEQYLSIPARHTIELLESAYIAHGTIRRDGTPALHQGHFMRSIFFALVAMTMATSHAFAQLPLLEDNDLVYAHHHLNVPNIDEAKKFWVDTLGGTPAPAGPLQMVKFPNVIIVFTQRAPTGGSKGTTVNHVGFSVPSVRQMIAKVKAAGYPIVTREEMPASQPVKDDIAYVEATKTNVAFAMLPEGTKVEFVENPSVAAPVSNHHVHFATEKVDEMQAWYVKTFGARAGMRGSFKAADLPGVNLTFGGTTEAVAGTRGRAIDHIGFEVKNLEAFCKQLEAQGITFDRPYTFIPQIGFAIAFLTDPFGTYIELTEGMDSPKPLPAKQ